MVKAFRDIMDHTQSVQKEIEENYEELFDKIYRYLRVRISSNEDAEDLAGEVFIKAWKRAGSYAPERGTVLMWLFGISKHEIATYWERRPVSQVDFEFVEPILQDEGRHMVRHNDTLDLERLMGHLSEEQRSLVARHYLDGVSYAEIAQQVRRTESGVRQIVSRAIRLLKKTNS